MSTSICILKLYLSEVNRYISNFCQDGQSLDMCSWTSVFWEFQITKSREIQLDEIDGALSSSVDPYGYNYPVPNESPVELD